MGENLVKLGKTRFVINIFIQYLCSHRYLVLHFGRNILEGIKHISFLKQPKGLRRKKISLGRYSQ